MGTQDTDHQGLQDEEKTHDDVHQELQDQEKTHDNVCQDLQDKKNTHFDPIKVNFNLEHPEQEIHEGQQVIALALLLESPTLQMHPKYGTTRAPPTMAGNSSTTMQWVCVWQGNEKTLVHKVKSRQDLKREH